MKVHRWDIFSRDFNEKIIISVQEIFTLFNSLGDGCFITISITQSNTKLN